MHKLTGKFLPRSEGSNPPRDPVMAAALSVVPGLGQLYNGQSTRGFLFFDVALVNFVIVWLMLFTDPIVRALSAFSAEFHVKPNEDLLRALHQMHIGTPVSSAVLLLFLGFIGYAARDAYDAANSKRLQAIYPDHAIEMPEATSGSYLIHLSMIVTCAVLALFFILPPPPRTQVTEFEFYETTHQTEQPKHATKVANHSSDVAAHHDPTRPLAMPHAAAPPASHATSQPKTAAPAHQTQTAQPRAAAQPASQPAQPRQTTPADAPPPAFRPKLVTPTTAVVSPVLPMTQAPTHTNSAPMPRPIVPSNAGMPATPAPQPLVHGTAGTGQPTPTAQPLLAMAGPGHTPSPHTGATPSNTASTQPGAPGPVHSNQQGTGPQPQPAATHGPAGPGQKGETGPAPVRFSPGRTGPGGNTLAATPAVPNGDQATPRTDGGPIVKEVQFGPYMAALQRRIRAHWFPPRVPDSKHTQVRFKISRSGELSGLRLVRSSGLAEEDRFALRAIEESAPFPPLPEGADETVDIEFTFDYNVFGTGRTEFRRF